MYRPILFVATRKRGAGKIEPSPEDLRRTIAVLAHELRNPLSALHAGVELLPEDDPQQGQLKEILLRQTIHMKRLVGDLSDISGARLGKLRIERETLRLQDVISESVENFKPTLTARRQRLNVHVPEDPIWVDGDRIRIGQVLNNLLSNASKYSDPESPIEMSVTVDSQEVVLGVRDFGIGIADEDLHRVFEFLSQSGSPEALEHRQGGMGIGLALVKQIVQQHDGTIRAHSDGLGHGSEFSVRLPIIRADDLQRKTDLDHRRFSSRRVLVVDDNRSSQYLLPLLIARLGSHEVQVAGNGEMAIELLKGFIPHLILLDLGMPDMSGIELARRVRANESLRETRIVALTGYDNEESREAATESGIDAYCVKPVSLAMLRDVFETFLPFEEPSEARVAVSESMQP